MLSQKVECDGRKGPLDHRLDDRTKGNIMASRDPWWHVISLHGSSDVGERVLLD